MNKPNSILHKWLDSINQRDLSALLSLYDEKAILIPTFSNRILDSQSKIRDYFEKLNSHEELHVSLHEKTVKIQEITEGIYTVCGIYLWRLAIEEEMLSFEARFSYVLDVDSDRPVMQHHSSQIPRML